MREASSQRPRSIIVQKFGGTSVGSLERIEKSARIVLDKWKMGSAPVVVVSAMSGETNRLESMAREIGHHENAAMDLVLSAGEQVTVGLMSLMLDRLAREEGLIGASESIAEPALAHQLPIGTHSQEHADAVIDYVNNAKVYANADLGKITVLPGYQAFNGEEVLTLGRGGSDTSAVSIAGLLHATLCEIYTDVDGVYSADPRLCGDAIKYNLITTDEMQILSRNGAKVMHHKAIDAAHAYKVPVVVKSSFEPLKQGTLIVHPSFVSEIDESEKLEQSSYIYGLTAIKDVMVLEIPKKEGLEQELKEGLSMLSLTAQEDRLQVIFDSKYWNNLEEILSKQEISINAPKTLYGKISILGENLDNSKEKIGETIEGILDGSSNEVKGVEKNGEVVSILVNRDSLSEIARKIHGSCLSLIGPKLKDFDPSVILDKLTKTKARHG